MAAQRIVMPRIKELLRLRYECAPSFEPIGHALQRSKGVVAMYVKSAEVCGPDWPQLRAKEKDEARFRLSLGRGRGAAPRHVAPDLAYIHQDRKRNGVTPAMLWEEYR